MDLGEVRLEHFRAHVGEGFHVEVAEDRGCELKLLEAEPIRSGGPGEAFSLVFEGPADVPLSQQTYEFENGTLGRLPIFLVPISAGQDAVRYEAVFSRLPSGDAPAP